MKRTLLNDLESLGIPCPLWDQCLTESRDLAYAAWAVRWVKVTPHGVSKQAWSDLAHEVYENGPMAAYIRRRLN